MEQMISELHQRTQEEPGMWVHNWDWTQVTEYPNRPGDNGDQRESFHSDEEEGIQGDKTANNEKHLGAANEEETANNGSGERSGPRRSQRSWAPTRKALESQGQQWDFRGEKHRRETDLTPPRLPPEREPIDQEPEDEDPHHPPEPPCEAPPIEIGHDDLDLNPTPEDDPGEPDNIILEPLEPGGSPGPTTRPSS